MPITTFSSSAQSAAKSRPQMRKMPIAEKRRKLAIPRLSHAEEAFISGLETASGRGRTISAADEKYLFEIYGRFSRDAEELEELLESGKANGESEAAKTGLIRFEELTQRYTRLLTIANQGLIIRIANRVRKTYLFSDLNLQELVNEAPEGVRRAVQKFDLSMGTRFPTYMAWWARNSIQKAAKLKGRKVRLPLQANDEMTRINTVLRESRSRNNTIPTEAELAEKVGISQKRLGELMGAFKAVFTEEHTIPNEISPSAFSIVAGREEVIIIRRCIGEFTYPQQYILARMFGLCFTGGEEASMAQIGRDLDVSRARIQFIKKQLMERLQKKLIREGIVKSDLRT